MEERKYYIVKDRKLWTVERLGVYDSKLENIQIMYGKFEILSEEDEEIECVNAYKLIETPYMADCLRKGNYDIFTELLKQSELELVERINDLTEAVKQLNKKIKE